MATNLITLPTTQIDKNYSDLYRTLMQAFGQAAYGKAKERHAPVDTPFDRQPILEIGRMVGPGYNLGQAMKKCQEAMRFITLAESGAYKLSAERKERARAELYGAINYIASAILLVGDIPQPSYNEMFNSIAGQYEDSNNEEQETSVSLQEEEHE